MLRQIAGSLLSKPLCNAVAEQQSRRLLQAAADAAGRGTAAGGPGASSMMEEAATARLKQIRSQLEATGELPPEEPPSAAWRVFRGVWNTMLAGTAALGAAAGYYTYFYTPMQVDDMIKKARSSSGSDAAPPWTQAWINLMERYLDTRINLEAKVKEFTDPSYDRLLPDLHPQLRGNIITLVLDLDELLVFKEWTRQKGWSIYKRPGVQDFLLELAQFYEIVVFTDEPATYTDPILNKLDPHKAIAYRLYRTETQYHNGKHVRDLSKLNRDLTHVLMISAKPEAWEFQPDNTLKLRPWKGQVGDTALVDLVPFLQFLATRRIFDVREVARSYDGVDDIPQAFKARLAAAAAHQKQPKRNFLASR